MTPTRQHETVITLPASPEEVWQALTTASLLESWYAPEARIDARPGGEYFVSWGPGMEGGGRIEIFEPGRHLRLTHERNQAPMAIDFFLEVEGGSTILRLVHSGFLSAADWDNEYNGTKQGWPIMLRILRYSLSTHPGIAGRQRWLYLTAPEPQAAAWTRIIGLFKGVTPEYSKEPFEFAAEIPDGLAYAALAERAGTTGITLYVVLYGDAIARLDEATAQWKSNIEALYPQTVTSA